MNMTIIDKAKEYVTELFRGNADGHDAGHSLRVFRNAMSIAEHYPDCDITEVALAALLHDADDYKLFRTENNANARAFLSREGVDPETADRICGAIKSVSFSKNLGKRPETLEAMIVQDA
ncbi:MAG: HD domain-containing protein, partial [Clostridia bacterium]|nr:HD domain-containing protein [Clostridia bacterium]